MSLVLYNPLEASVLLISSWFLRRNKYIYTTFKFRNFIHKCLIMGVLNYIVQYPERYFQNSIYYIFYLIIANFALMGIILKIFGYNNSFLQITIIMLLFNLTLNLSIEVFCLPIVIKEIENNFICQFVGNFMIRSFQYLIIFILFGGFKMFKEFLKAESKKNLGKMVASTIRGWGETKLTKKLAKEVKESK